MTKRGWVEAGGKELNVYATLIGWRHMQVVLNILSLKPQMGRKLERSVLLNTKWQRLYEFADLAFLKRISQEYQIE